MVLATPPTDAATGGPRRLRLILAVLDTLAIVVSWTTFLVAPFATRDDGASQLGPLLGVLAAVAAVGLTAVRASQLYLARVCDNRAVEIERLLRVAAITGVAGYVVINAIDADFYAMAIVYASASTFMGLCLVRGAYRGALRAVRRDGGLARRALVVGTDDEGVELIHSITLHPELGYRLVGVLGELSPAALVAGEAVTWYGEAAEVTNVLDCLEKAQANTVFLAASAFSVEHTNELIRALLERDVHVHLATGLRGFAQRRMRPHRFAYDTLFYLEAPHLARWQLALKRAMDIAGGLIGCVLALPVLAVAAVLIKLDDRGPVFFRQERVGQNGTTFGLLKLRTMVVDAEARRREIEDENVRTGPLFKVDHDPRTTRIGRILRASSLDELPQLFNVVAGHMSLVGPRPALPSEVEKFHERLRQRERVPPGITGLWQIEGRDNPSFRAYERFDLYYVENWSLLLDLAIVLTTVGAVVSRFAGAVRSSEPRAGSAPRAA